MEPNALAAKRLANVLGRKEGSQANGLHHALRALAGQRKGHAQMSAMNYDEATNHLLMQWDHKLLSKLLPEDFGTVASGGGGGDPCACCPSACCPFACCC